MLHWRLVIHLGRLALQSANMALAICEFAPEISLARKGEMYKIEVEGCNASEGGAQRIKHLAGRVVRCHVEDLLAHIFFQHVRKGGAEEFSRLALHRSHHNYRASATSGCEHSPQSLVVPHDRVGPRLFHLAIVALPLFRMATLSVALKEEVDELLVVDAL